MADIKLSELPSLAVLTDASLIPVVESGATKKIVASSLKTYVTTGLQVDVANLVGTTLASSVVNSSLTSIGTLSTLSVTGLANTGSISTESISTGDLTVTNPVVRPVAIITRRHNTAQNTVSEVDTRVIYNTIEDTTVDTGIVYDSSSNIGRFTNTSGATRVFSISTTVVFASTSTAGSRVIYIKKNGTDRVAQSSAVAITQNGGTSNQATVLNVSTTIKLTNNEYFEVVAWQNSNNAISLGSGGGFDGSYIAITWI